MDEEQYINIEDGLSVGYIGGFDEELYERIDVIEGKIEEINSSLDNMANKEHTHEPQKNCDTVDNLHLVYLTRAEFDALTNKDNNTVYLVKE